MKLKKNQKKNLKMKVLLILMYLHHNLLLIIQIVFKMNQTIYTTYKKNIKIALFNNKKNNLKIFKFMKILKLKQNL